MWSPRAFIRSHIKEHTDLHSLRLVLSSSKNGMGWDGWDGAAAFWTVIVIKMNTPTNTWTGEDLIHNFQKNLPNNVAKGLSFLIGVLAMKLRPKGRVSKWREKLKKPTNKNPHLPWPILCTIAIPNLLTALTTLLWSSQWIKHWINRRGKSITEIARVSGLGGGCRGNTDTKVADPKKNPITNQMLETKRCLGKRIFGYLDGIFGWQVAFLKKTPQHQRITKFKSNFRLSQCFVEFLSFKYSKKWWRKGENNT